MIRLAKYKVAIMEMIKRPPHGFKVFLPVMILVELYQKRHFITCLLIC